MPSTSTLLLGAEAVAFGALDAGIVGAFSYAGTPATEVFETVQAEGGVWAVWSANEKVAYEEALGVSYTGRRALVSMKHVGLNVAADPFMSSALTGANGGLVLVVADDPGMHSSQNEQDSRFYADFARIPCFEPANQQQCYDMTREAFGFSEAHRIPVMVRLVTRVAHSRANVVRVPPEDRGPGEPNPSRPDPNDWTLVPANARRRYRHLLDIQRDLQDELEASPANRYLASGRRGILSAGIATNYVREALAGRSGDTTLHIGAYPLPVRLIREFVDRCNEILVVEEGFPFIETRLLGLLGVPGKTVRGKLDGSLPMDGELLPEAVFRALGIPLEATPTDPMVAGRPPQFCKGCPHGSSFGALVDATAPYPDALIFGDIGCYALGIMPPYRAIHACVDMGASIGLAHGASRAGAHPVLCTIGDSTFAHSGMPALLDVVHSNANVTVLILDNGTTAMTGAQDSHATGEVLLQMLRGLGVTDLTVFDPLPKHHADSVRLIREAIERPGPSVLVAKRACVRIKLGTRATPLPQSGT
ncbi:MAG: hypothetical protein KIS66_07785 [Fimbriimonadaceae bacterium]|nr:hypothetical protein [Fimbriimonadaceae bacterium]